MNMLTVCALVCTIAALAGSAVLPEAKAERNETAMTHLVKRSFECGGGGWSEFSGRCFYYVATPMSWAKAENNCLSMGAHLASVHNCMEYHELRRFILNASHEDKETWIGGSDAQEESHWFWSDGTTFNYTNWCRGEPNNHKGPQECLKMNHGAEKCWDDMGCLKVRPSVCAKDVMNPGLSSDTGRHVFMSSSSSYIVFNLLSLLLFYYHCNAT